MLYKYSFGMAVRISPTAFIFTLPSVGQDGVWLCSHAVSASVSCSSSFLAIICKQSHLSDPFTSNQWRDPHDKWGDQILLGGAMFKIGEKVVYPAHGVGQIEAIRKQVILGSEKKFYMLRILDTDMKIMIPVDNVQTVGLRKVIDRHMVSMVYKVLRQKKVETDQQTWNRRYREYTEKIKTGSILEIATVLRDLFLLKGDKELSFGERKVLDTARNLLVKELSIARSHSEEKILEELRHMFTH